MALGNMGMIGWKMIIVLNFMEIFDMIEPYSLHEVFLWVICGNVVRLCSVLYAFWHPGI